MTPSRNAILIAIFGVALAIVALIIGSRGQDSNVSARAITGTGGAPGGMRTVLVSREKMPPPSRAGAPLHALRVSGPLPSRGAIGTVLSDENCMPDSRGVSNCVNEIGLPGGRLLRVRHPHRMTEVPCLSPGEQVNVRAA